MQVSTGRTRLNGLILFISPRTMSQVILPTSTEGERRSLLTTVRIAHEFNEDVPLDYWHGLLSSIQSTGNAVDDDIGELRGLVVADDVVVIIVRQRDRAWTGTEEPGVPGKGDDLTVLKVWTISKDSTGFSVEISASHWNVGKGKGLERQSKA
ncbi:hypothetical protein EDD16DRAFT_1517723 [Pisolithus croceorrhizus]|nr:hypothetical protein EDD16DRAFT_1517723 [Pisolithus croceorrhizus]